MPAQGYIVSSPLEERLKGRRIALNALRMLPDDYRLFYTPALRSTQPVAGAEPYEPAVDYILAHKEKGLLGIVVKTGEIVEEGNGLISQYQPTVQLYRILDPVRPADAALRGLLNEFDADAQRVYPCGIAVLLPESRRFEFSQPQSCYVFGEEIDSLEFEARLGDLFLHPVENEDYVAFDRNFSKLCDFLNAHSDNAAVLGDTREKLKLVAEAKKPTAPVGQGHLRMKVVEAVPQPVHAEQAVKTALSLASPKAFVSPPKVQVKKAAPKNLAIVKAEQGVAYVKPVVEQSLRQKVAQKKPPAQRDFFTWLQEVEKKGEGDAALSSASWALLLVLSAIVIGVAYYAARKLPLFL